MDDAAVCLVGRAELNILVFLEFYLALRVFYLMLHFRHGNQAVQQDAVRDVQDGKGRVKEQEKIAALSFPEYRQRGGCHDN